MYFGAVLLICLGGFGLQLWLCLEKNDLVTKLAPAGLLVLLQGLVWLFCNASGWLERLLGEWVFYAAFGAAVLSMPLWMVLAAEALAWAVYGIVRVVQKHRK